MSEFEGKPISCKAMVARAAKQPLVAEEITVDPPKAGEGNDNIWKRNLFFDTIFSLHYSFVAQFV